MNWVALNNVEQLQHIKAASENRPQVIYKHSTRCGISSMVLSRLERSIAPDSADFWFLDLIRYRDVSNKVAELFQVHHESPQVIIIRNGMCMYDESHYSITMDDIENQLMA